jgi:hypothetical protein
MLAYNFNEDGEFIGREEMLQDPLEPGRYLQPDNSTLVPPPEFNPKTSTCRWNGMLWAVETIVEPEEPAEQKPTEEELRRLEILTLKGKLAADDYKIIKCAEYTAAGRELPYNIEELNAARDALRAEINALEAQAADNAVE